MGNALIVTTRMSSADEYRYVPKDARHKSILEKSPVMAAQKHLMAALSLSLKSVK